MNSLRKAKRSSHTAGRKVLGGFSLIELMTVLVIIAILSAFAIPTISVVMAGTQMTTSSQMLGDQISLARQTALSSNHNVEVRFYQFADPNMPGETTPSTGKYRAIQAFEILDSGSAMALGKVQHIAASIIIA